MEAFDLCVPLEDKPGAFAGAAEALAHADVNVEGVAGWGAGSEGGALGQAHFLVTDVQAATTALTDAGYSIERTREALFASIANQPGALDRYTAKLSQAGVNIEAVYLAAGTRLVIVTDNVARARVVWEEVAAGR